MANNTKDFLDFVKVWNDVKLYPANYDLERKLGQKIGAIRKKTLRYEAYRRAHPDIKLPELVLRRLITGGIASIPEGIIKQLDPFRVDVEKIKKMKSLVITSHQFGASLNKWFWRSLMHFEKERCSFVLVLNIKYGPVKTAHQKETCSRILTSTFPEELKGRILFDDLLLCKGELMLNVTRMRPTLERFLTDTICEMGGNTSQIFAAPKFELEYRPRAGRKYPKAIMTTGACHYPNYMVDNLGQQDRTAEVATDAHTFGAIVVEMDGKSFHFRQLHANKRGRFYDINPKRGGADYFTHKGVEHRPHAVSGIVLGDWHTGKTDKTVRKTTFGRKSITKVLRPDHIVLHDFVDCDSVSPYEKQQSSRRGYKAPIKHDSLSKELVEAVKELEWMHSHTNAQLHVIASNHNEYVTEYIETMRWGEDNINLEIGSQLFNAMVGDLKARRPAKAHAKAIDPIAWWFRIHAPFVKVHERQNELLLPPKSRRPILCSMHGDKGPRGVKTRSTKVFQCMNVRIILGHNHSGKIFGPVWRVGTSTPLMQFYVTASSTDWTNTHCIIYENSQRQLINIVNGRWYGKRQWENLDGQ